MSTLVTYLLPYYLTNLRTKVGYSIRLESKKSTLVTYLPSY